MGHRGWGIGLYVAPVLAAFAVASLGACEGGSDGSAPQTLCNANEPTSSTLCIDASYDGPIDDGGTFDVAPSEASVDAAMEAGAFPVLPTCIGTFGLDPTFGTSGIVIDPTEANEGLYSVTAQTDGKYLVGGDSFLARYQTTGAIDTSFAANGYLSFPDETAIESVLVQSNGAIVVGGVTADGCLLSRFTAAGAVDPSFGTGGSTACVTAAPQFASTVQRPDGTFVIAGSGMPITPGVSDFGVAQLTANGNFDMTFGKGGFAYAGFPGVANPVSVALQVDGKIIVAGEVPVDRGAMPSQVGVARFLANGTLDTTFGTGGRATVTLAHFENGGTRVALQSTGGIVVIGASAPVDGVFDMARFTTAGQLDMSFGTAGVASVSFPGNGAFGAALNVMGGDVLLVGGTFHTTDVNGSDIAQLGFARFTANGAVDTTFGTAGLFMTTLPTETEGTYFNNQFLLPNGGLVAVATGSHDLNGDVFQETVIARYACH